MKKEAQETSLMKILILGGNGFIGKELAKFLSLNHDVHVIDINSNFDLSNVKFTHLDLSNEKSVNEFNWEGYDIIFHFAAQLGVGNFKSIPSKSFLINQQINYNLLKIFDYLKYTTHIVFASTSEVYGAKFDIKESNNFQILNNPRGAYALDKLWFEFKLKELEIPCTILRFFNIVGKGQSDVHGHVIPSFINKCLKNQTLTLYNMGSDVRSFCDIRDCVQMIDRVKMINDDFNIGNSLNTCTMIELAKLIKKLTCSKSIFKFEENLMSIPFRSPNTSKIEQYYKPIYSLENIVKSLIPFKS